MFDRVFCCARDIYFHDTVFANWVSPIVQLQDCLVNDRGRVRSFSLIKQKHKFSLFARNQSFNQLVDLKIFPIDLLFVSILPL